ncbi:bifunctional uridylate/adenylate kinase [Dispira simplex]|nr:bifunctional uridylate/adenylate kinase [Dispira simplex]
MHKSLPGVLVRLQPNYPRFYSSLYCSQRGLNSPRVSARLTFGRSFSSSGGLFKPPKLERKLQERLSKTGSSSSRFESYWYRLRPHLPTVPAALCVLSIIVSYFYLQDLSNRDRIKAMEANAEKAKLMADTGFNPNDMVDFHGLKFPKLKKEDSPFSLDNTTVVFVLGGPGAGKGTQCTQMVKEFGFVHLSAGDLLREEQSRPGSDYGELIKWCIKEGQIVPEQVTITLLREAMKRSGGHKFLIDGFPRAMSQALAFEEVVCPARLVLNFECPEDVLQERLLKRGETSGRTDDNIQSIRKRFQTFVVSCYPVINYYTKQEKCITINSARSVDEVSSDVKRIMRKLLTVHPTSSAPTSDH